MKILITGSKGQLGLEIINQLKLEDKYEIIATDRNNLDITNMDNVSEVILHNKPDIVINSAAHTAVDLCETDIENAYKINAIGPRNLAIVCEKTGAKFVQVSTDYVLMEIVIGRIKKMIKLVRTQYMEQVN